MTIGISFSGGGGLLFYYLGIASVLKKEFDLEGVELCGRSAGAFAAFCLATINDIERFFHKFMVPALQKLQLGAIGDEFVPLLIKKCAHLNLVARAGKRLHIIISKIKRNGEISAFDANTWDNNHDLIQAVFASCFVPYVLGPRVCNLYRGKHCLDGGAIDLGLNTPSRPHEFVRTPVDWIYVSPAAFLGLPRRTGILIGASLIPISTNVWTAEYLFALGKRHALNNLSYFRNLRARKDRSSGQ